MDDLILKARIHRVLRKSAVPVPTTELVNALAIDLPCARQQVWRDLRRLEAEGRAVRTTRRGRPGRKRYDGKVNRGHAYTLWTPR